MTDMDHSTGQPIDGIDSIRQAVRDILTTRIGTRVMRRDYGSLLPELIDQPLNDATLLRAYSAAITALLIWEPRIRVTRIRQSIAAERPGAALFRLEAITNEAAQPLDIEVAA